MVYEVIKKALIKELGIDEELITPQAKLEDDLELDSTDTVVLALELKKQYGIDYKFSNNNETLAEICNELEQKLAAVEV